MMKIIKQFKKNIVNNRGIKTYKGNGVVDHFNIEREITLIASNTVNY